MLIAGTVQLCEMTPDILHYIFGDSVIRAAEHLSEDFLQLFGRVVFKMDELVETRAQAGVRLSELKTRARWRQPVRYSEVPSRRSRSALTAGLPSCGT